MLKEHIPKCHAVPTRSVKKVLLRVLVGALIASTSTFIAACGSDSGGGGSGGAAEGFQRISQVETMFSPDDLDAIGFKKSRSYDIETLPGASAAIFGFWRIADNTPIDFEVRFYDSHADAVGLGEALADEGSGSDAILDDAKATYKEGVKDRRMIVGKGPGGGGRSGTGPRYGDYAIYGNVVMLCAGAEIVQALERCEELAMALSEASAP